MKHSLFKNNYSSLLVKQVASGIIVCISIAAYHLRNAAANMLTVLFYIQNNSSYKVVTTIPVYQFKELQPTGCQK